MAKSSNAGVEEPKSTFVGRESELRQLSQLLEAGKAPWFAAVHSKGQGGIGKTQLLLQFRKLCDREGLLCVRDLIDFYETRARDELGLQRMIAEFLGRELFEDFEGALDNYYKKPAGQRFMFRDVVQRAFLNDWESLPHDCPIVLLFDTFEVIQESELATWFIGGLLPLLKKENPALVVVVAGRNAVEWRGEPAECVDLELLPFAQAETEEFLAKNGLGDMERQTIHRIHRLSAGHPILLSLAVDWLKTGIDLSDLFRGKLSKDEFKSRLVGKIGGISEEWHTVILLMAHAYRRFDSEILAALWERSIEECEQVLQQLTEFPFIKLKPHSGGYFLHDEMRDLVNEYIWPKRDRLGTYRQSLDKVLIEYYDSRLDKLWAELEEAEPKDRKQYGYPITDYERESLFYRLRIDYEGGFEYYKCRFDLQYERGDDDGCQALNQETELYGLETDEKRAEWCIREAKVATQSRQPRDAETVFRHLNQLTGLSLDNRLRQQVLYWMGESALYCRPPSEALTWYERSLDVAKQMGDLDALQEVYESIGFMYRLAGDWEQARNYYTQSLDRLEGLGDAAAVAQALNNLSYVLLLQGSLNAAFDYCKLGLSIRRSLPKRLRDIGLSLSTLGQIFEAAGKIGEAMERFSQALNIFEEQRDDRMRAKTLMHLGYVYHLFGESPKGLNYLGMALEHFRDTRSTEDLIKVSNLMGKVRFDLARSGQEADQAAGFFVDSFSLAEKWGYSYWIVVNSLDLVLLYRLFSRPDLVDQYLNRGVEVGLQKEYFGLLAPLEKVAGDIEFMKAVDADESERLQMAFEHYAKACEYAVIHNVHTASETVGQIFNRILQLPAEQRVHYADFLGQYWLSTRLVDRFPESMRTFELAKRYSDFAARNGSEFSLHS